MTRSTTPTALILGLLLLCTTPTACAATPEPKGDRDGETRRTATDALQAWDARSDRWVDPESFWRSYADARGGLRWGQRTTYPPYAEVNERDLLLIESPSGLCLMEFWHRRWRRAQDVRRWSPDFNEYGGCPRVFD